MGSQPLQETLQTEFSPPLDTSLIAAILADYVTDSCGTPSAEEIRSLRNILAELAAQAENQIGADDLVADISNIQLADYTEDSCGTASAADLFSAESSTTNTAATSELVTNGQQASGSPLKFLQTVFPHLSLDRLKSALGSTEDAETIDMESIVEDIISAEFARELEERGGEEAAKETYVEQRWETVQPRSVAKRQKRKSGKTITLVDIRQKQHVPTSSSASSPRASAPDPWTQLSSVASHLETLISSRTAAYFQSIFHSPQYSTPSEALRAALISVAPHAAVSTEMTPGETQSLFGMFDILRASPTWEILPDVDREQTMSDAQLALRATQGRPDPAIDIVWLLRELDGGEVDWGVYHSPVPSSPTLSGNTSSNGQQPKLTTKLPSDPSSVLPSRHKARSFSSSPSGSPFPPSAHWQTVPMSPRRSPNLHADFIPSYNGNGQSNKKAAKSHKERAGELMQKRREALREASRAWQKGNSSTRGGEVALYYAERAREFQDKAQAEKFDIVWNMVQSSRVEMETGSIIDLHGATVAEAIQVVKKMLAETPSTATQPLKIITGRGKHSANGVGVLGPAVRNALAEDGWNVDKWHAGIVVRGRTARRL